MLCEQCPQTREAEHLTPGVMGLHQAITIKQDIITGDQYHFLFLVDHCWHQSERHEPPSWKRRHIFRQQSALNILGRLQFLFEAGTFLKARMLLGESLFLLYTRNHLFRHLIELPLQLPDFIPPGDRNSLRIVAIGKFCRGTHKTVNTPYYVTGGQHAKERAKSKQEEQPGRRGPGPDSHKRCEDVT